MKKANTIAGSGSRVLSASLVLAFLLCAVADASGIETGMDASEVRAALGEPVGTMELRDKTVLMYPRGEVTIIEGKVADFKLIDEATFAEKQSRLERERAEWQAQQEKLKEIREAEGRQIRESKRSSTAFGALPAEDRLRYWRAFQDRYPEVDVTAEIIAAREEYEAFRLEEERRREIEDLKRQVAEAKEEAAEARRETERLRRELQRRPWRSYPVYIRQPHYPAPHPEPAPANPPGSTQ